MAQAILLLTALLPASISAQDAAGTIVWGYVSTVDGMSVVLDDGTSIQLTDATNVVKIDGSKGGPEDILRRIKLEATVDAAGSASRVELLPAPLSAEYHLSTMTVRGATTTSPTVAGRTYPRSLAAIKATFTGRPDTVALEGALAYTPPEGAKTPAAAKFAVINPASDTLFQRTVSAGEVVEFRLNHAAGQAQTLTLVATPAGEGALQPEWCLWLDVKLMAPLPTVNGMTVFTSTVQKLVANLRAALGEAQPGPMAVCLFTGLRIRDNQLLPDLQEDLVVHALGSFQVVGESAQRPEIGIPLTDAIKADVTKAGAKCVLVGSVSDRQDILVVNAVIVDVESGRILAAARAWQ